MNNCGDVNAINWKLSCQGTNSYASFVGFSNILYISPRQFCSAVCLAAWMSGAALLFCILHVIRLSSQKKMFDVYAKTVVAFVAYVQSAWMFSAKKQPCETVCQPWTPLERRAAVSAWLLTTKFCACPQNASVGVRLGFRQKSVPAVVQVPSAMWPPCCFHAVDCRL